MKWGDYYKTYLTFTVLLGCAFSLPHFLIDPIRMGVISTISLPFLAINKETSLKDKQELELENAWLKEKLREIHAFLLSEEHFDEMLEKLSMFKQSHLNKDFLARREQEILQNLKFELSSIPAKVIYREPSSWNSFIWVSAGEKDNERNGSKIIAKNSPVIVGESLIGVVESVYKYQSKIRLITDASLTPSVRVVRGAETYRLIAYQIDDLLKKMSLMKDLFFDDEEKEKSLEMLLKIKNRAQGEIQGDLYLAKGQLQGLSFPLWRGNHTLLKGIGFNYDFDDEEGPARELETGKILKAIDKDKGVSLIQNGDLLISSGLDGVFPSGFHVAIVKKVYPLKEGSYTYNIDAEMTAGSLDMLEMVWILPPISEEKL